MAALISGPGGGGCLVPLAPRPGAPAVVLIHAASGSVLPFRELAELLAPDFSVYGLQAPAEGGASIGELARRYVEEVEPVRGLSPVCLVGWSMGGCVALEMDRLWRERDVVTAATVMLDSWVPPAVHLDPADRLRARTAIEDLDIGAAEGVDLAALGAEIIAVTARNRQALLDYVPAPFGGRVHLLSAAEPLAAARVLPPGDGSRWRAVIEDLVHERTPGDHLTLLRAGNATSLAATLRQILADSLAFTEI
jgi:thioesterase domain-containing protein